MSVRPGDEMLIVAIFMAVVYIFSVHSTWTWKNRHLNYPNGYPGITGTATDVELFMGILLAISFAVFAIAFWLQSEPGGIWWPITAGSLLLIQILMITKHRMTWDEYWKLKDERSKT